MPFSGVSTHAALRYWQALTWPRDAAFERALRQTSRTATARQISRKTAHQNGQLLRKRRQRNNPTAALPHPYSARQQDACCRRHPANRAERPALLKRNRFKTDVKQTRTRQKQRAEDAGERRDTLLHGARQDETAIRIEAWLQSPGLRPPR